MAAYFIVIWSEVLVPGDRIAFTWNGRAVLASEAFERLQVVLEVAQRDGRKVSLIIKGHLGRDVCWESILSSHAGSDTRLVFSKWYTQAVQAQAALVRQRVLAPPYPKGP